MQGKNEKLFISMPQYKTTDKEGKEIWRDIAYGHTDEARKEIEAAVVEAYKEELAKQLHMQGIEVSNITPVNKDSLKGLATIKIDEITVKNIRIVQGEKGLFVSMPQYKTTDKEGREAWKDIIYPTNKWQRNIVKDKVLEVYVKMLSPEKEKSNNKIKRGR